MWLTAGLYQKVIDVKVEELEEQVRITFEYELPTIPKSIQYNFLCDVR